MYMNMYAKMNRWTRRHDGSLLWSARRDSPEEGSAHMGLPPKVIGLWNAIRKKALRKESRLQHRGLRFDALLPLHPAGTPTWYHSAPRKLPHSLGAIRN